MRAPSARLAAVALVLAGGLPSSARQAGPSTARPTEVSGVTVVARRPTDVSGVTVTASACKARPVADDLAAAPPRVVSTVPAEGAVVAAGPLALTVVFDQRMYPCSFAYEPAFPLRFPDMPEPPTLLADGRTFVLGARVKAGLRYGLRLNGGGHLYFVSRAGRAAAPLEVRFSTSAAR